MRLLVLLLFGLFSCNIAAQTAPKLKIIIEDMDEDAIKCGISKYDLEATAKLTLRNNRISPVENPSELVASLYIALNVIRLNTGQGCVWNLNTSVYSFSQSDLTMNPLRGFSAKGRKTVLCDRNSLGVSNAGRASSAIFGGVEQTIKLCLGEMEY